MDGECKIEGAASTLDKDKRRRIRLRTTMAASPMCKYSMRLLMYQLINSMNMNESTYVPLFSFV